MTQVPILIVHQSVLGSIRYALGSPFRRTLFNVIRALILFIFLIKLKGYFAVYLFFIIFRITFYENVGSKYGEL